MPQFLLNIQKQLNEFWSNIERPKRTKLLVLFCLLVLLAVIMVFLLNQKEYVTLYNDLNPADAGEILVKLQEMNIDAKPVGNDTIMVAKNQEPGIRMQLSSQGYPKSGFNYDLFMNGVGFGTTDFEKQKYLQFQLQDRLQEAIRTLNGVSNAIVTISIPEQDSFVFTDKEVPATASVILELVEGYQITSKQVKGIEELVSKSILGLKPEDISIIDSDMNLLNFKGDEGPELAGTQLELENQVRERLQRQVISLLEPVFGYKKVLAAVNVRLNFDRQVTETIRFEPVVDDTGLVVSMTELKEKVKNSDAAGGVPGQDSNGAITVYPAVQGNGSDYDKVSKTVNYELNQINEQLEGAQGQIKELSVSVVIDSADIAPDVKLRVQDIIAGAVGIDNERIVVENMSFEGSNGLQDQINETMKVGGLTDTATLVKDLVVYGMIALLALIMVILIYKLVKEGMRANRVDTAVNIMDAITLNAPIFESVKQDDKQNEVQKEIEKLVKQRPDEVAQLLRTWLSDD